VCRFCDGMHVFACFRFSFFWSSVSCMFSALECAGWEMSS
jgi:hypothetical protein